MAKELLFIIDRDSDNRGLLGGWLEEEGYQVMTFENGESCLRNLDQNPAVICLDLVMPEMTGIETLKRINLINRDIPVIVVAGNNTVDFAVQAMKLGAFDYMLKPVDKIRLRTTIEKAIDMHSLIYQINQLRGELKKTYAYKNLVGQSEGMKRVFSEIEKATDVNINVFIEGESGTGKELVARAIHYSSSYREGNFVDINCGAIPEALQESEFFGHEKGAFTGAENPRKGKLEYADGGTLFLDEVGELSLKAQVKLLRFLQEKSFERVGGNKKIKVDLRIISATNRDLQKAVDEGRFRQDLYYRLVVFPITIPPLRERREDIPPLATHFLKKYKNETPNPAATIDADAMECLIKYDWPGNVRQLENAVFLAMVTTRGDVITPDSLPREIRRSDFRVAPDSRALDLTEPEILWDRRRAKPENERLPFSEIEKRAILDALRRNKGNIRETAVQLGVSRATLYRKIKKYRSGWPPEAS